MPSAHRRVGLLVDEPVSSVLDLFRHGADSATPEARLVRQAVVEGALVEALVSTALRRSGEGQRAAELVALVRELIPQLPLSPPIQDELLRSLDRAPNQVSAAERRRKQRALLHNAKRPANGQTAQDLADTFDAFERLPSR